MNRSTQERNREHASSSRLLKNAHLWRCAASLVNRHTSMYASFLGFCAPYIWTFLNSLFKIEFFNKLLEESCYFLAPYIAYL